MTVTPQFFEFDHNVLVHHLGAGSELSVRINGVAIDTTSVEIRCNLGVQANRDPCEVPQPLRKFRFDDGLARGLDLIAAYQASWRALSLRASGRRLRWRHDVVIA